MSIQKLIDTYAHWLKEEIVFKKMGEFYEITTPFYNNANDCIQIYIRLEGETVLFTDDGYTLNPLYMTGLQLAPAQKKALDSILRQYGVTLNGNALETKSSIETFAQRKQFVFASNHACRCLFIRCMSHDIKFVHIIREFIKEGEM